MDNHYLQVKKRDSLKWDNTVVRIYPLPVNNPNQLNFTLSLKALISPTPGDADQVRQINSLACMNQPLINTILFLNA